MPKIVLNQRSYFYEQLGKVGEPLVFLSGLGGDHRAFSRPMRHFAANFRTLALDSRDVGQSDRFLEPYTTADMADDVIAWLEAIDVQSAHLLGHSLGGLVAQQVALRKPGLLKSLILVSTHAGSNDWRKAVISSWVAMRPKLDIGTFTRSVMPWLVSHRFYRDQAQIEGLVQFAERNTWIQDPEAFSRQAQAAQQHDLRDQLAGIQLPCLVMVGADDIVNPPTIAQELANMIQNAKLVVLPGVGHMPHVEDQTQFREALEAFLGSMTV